MKSFLFLNGYTYDIYISILNDIFFCLLPLPPPLHVYDVLPALSTSDALWRPLFFLRSRRRRFAIEEGQAVAAFLQPHKETDNRMGGSPTALSASAHMDSPSRRSKNKRIASLTPCFLYFFPSFLPCMHCHLPVFVCCRNTSSQGHSAVSPFRCRLSAVYTGQRSRVACRFSLRET